MLTRNRTRTTLAELKQQQQPNVEPAVIGKKPQQGSDRAEKIPASTPGELQPANAVDTLATKMNIISIGSSSDDDDTPGDSERSAIDLSESSDSVIDLSSSSSDDEDVDGDESCSSEDEDEDEDEEEDEGESESESQSDASEVKDRGAKKSTSSTPVSKLLTEDVAKLIRGGDSKGLKADDCKTYLRKFGLRISGTKAELIGRIKQHIELNEGGSRKYARSTFVRDCKGNVCKGDVVLFDQKVQYKSVVASKLTKKVGFRTVAGRVVKESYGAQRQQHTFTVEVLWSVGCRQLAQMKQLLVKGRHLYRRRPRRQLWEDEEERTRALAEKYERGDAAREVRAIRQGRFKGPAGGVTQRSEGLPKKQLANPYTNTLTSNQSSHVLRSHVSSKTVVFQSEIQNVSSSSTSYGGSHRRQAAVPYGLRQSVRTQPPQRPPLITGHNTSFPCQSVNISSTAHRGSLGWQAVPAGVRQSGSIQPPERPPLVAAGQSTGLPCSTQSCTNTGSSKCSSGVCYPCCKKKGEPCRNPKHKPKHP